MVVMIRAAYRVFWGERGSISISASVVREVSARMWVPMVFLAGMCGLLGIYPQMPHPLPNSAAVVLATLGR
jgi:formate hydrogenlyase subunit 3/multisubunit Na+/H+ antiporter MnhD subunit